MPELRRSGSLLPSILYRKVPESLRSFSIMPSRDERKGEEEGRSRVGLRSISPSGCPSTSASFQSFPGICPCPTHTTPFGALFNNHPKRHKATGPNLLCAPTVRRLVALITVTGVRSSATTHQHLRWRARLMITKIRLALSIIVIVVLFLTSMTGCGGGSGDPAGSSPGSPPATATAARRVNVTGLDPNSRYYFAVSAYNGVSGPCSNEVSTVPPPSGAVSLAWDLVQDASVTAYEVHYGKQSSGQPRSCLYSDVMRVAALP
jgi:hypothetical protein